jgi:hypothetical protein
MPTVAQIRRIQFNDEEIGMGFNSESGLAIGSALEGFAVREDASAPGQTVSSSITIVTSHEELMSTLDMSFGPGSEKIRATLGPDGRQGFNDSLPFNVVRR